MTNEASETPQPIPQMNTDSDGRKQEVSVKKDSKSLMYHAIDQLLRAKEGDLVEITVPLHGPMDLAFSQGIEPHFDAKGHVQFDFTTEGGYRLPTSTTALQSTDEKTDPISYANHWGWGEFRKSLVALTARAKSQEKRAQENELLKKSKLLRVKTATKYIREGIAYEQTEPLVIGVKEAITAILKGETSRHDLRFVFSKSMHDAEEIIQRCYEPNLNKLEISHGSDKGVPCLVAKIGVKIKRNFPADMAYLVRGEIISQYLSD